MIKNIKFSIAIDGSSASGKTTGSKILSKKPKYDLAFYFKCSLEVAAYRRWLDLKKKIPIKDVKNSLKKRTNLVLCIVKI